MVEEEEPVALVVFEASRCLMARRLDLDEVTTVIALISEDPASWDEALSAWPRYWTPAVCEFASSLPIEEADREEAATVIATAESWVAIDFRDQRLLSGGKFMPVGRDATFAMVVDETGRQHCPLSIHLPPWWELREGVAPELVNRPRQSPIQKPHVDRDVLYGDALLSSIAAGALKAVDSESFRQSNAETDGQARYEFTLDIHRDWLMTPREDLGGRMPRELLHGALEWSGKVTWGQRLRFDDGAPMVALPDDWTDHKVAPMGSQEMCLYFDLCRELIGASWSWCASEKEALTKSATQDNLARLTQFLREVKNAWMDGSFEGGSPPSFIIQCDRRRVPRGLSVAIDGIDGVESEQHLADCDCPICEMMADGTFGVSFTSIDGHHLELDQEFAFSMIETLEDWEQQQREDAEFRQEMERKWRQRDANGQADETDDPFASVWSGIRENDDADGGQSPFAGKRGGFLKMAFMVAELVGDLETVDAAHDDIRALNESFANYRRCDDGQRAERASALKDVLQLLADRYPDLVSKSADLQSRIDEAARCPPIDDIDLPF